MTAAQAHRCKIISAILADWIATETMAADHELTLAEIAAIEKSKANITPPIRNRNALENSVANFSKLLQKRLHRRN